MPRSVVSLLLAVAVLATPEITVAQRSDHIDLFQRMVERVEEQRDDLVELRHDIHRHPELSGEEERTASLVANRLSELGFDVRTGVGGHGVIGILEGGLPGPMVAFRADMDAVRSSATDPVDYRSTNPGVRHICGHDVHTTIGIGLAEGFSAIQDQMPGSVMLIFQPAEETGTGANAMLADGAFDSVRPDAVFAVHTSPYNVGEVSTMPGGMMAGRASIRVTISGSGDRAGAASLVRRTIQNEGTISQQEAAQTTGEDYVFIQLFGGGANAASSETVVNGQVMTAGYDARERAKTAIVSALESLDIPEISLDIDYDDKMMEGVTNDVSLVETSNAGIQSFAPDISIRTEDGAPPLFSEDFGSFQALTPGVMYFLGVSNPVTGTVGMPHTPNYVADDEAIFVGTRAMLAGMFERLMTN